MSLIAVVAPTVVCKFAGVWYGFSVVVSVAAFIILQAQWQLYSLKVISVLLYAILNILKAGE